MKDCRLYEGKGQNQTDLQGNTVDWWFLLLPYCTKISGSGPVLYQVFTHVDEIYVPELLKIHWSTPLSVLC